MVGGTAAKRRVMESVLPSVVFSNTGSEILFARLFSILRPSITGVYRGAKICESKSVIEIFTGSCFATMVGSKSYPESD